MATEYLLQKSFDAQVKDVSEIVGISDNNEAKEEAGESLIPLHYAAWNNKLEAVQSLIKYGAGISLFYRTNECIILKQDMMLQR